MPILVSTTFDVWANRALHVVWEESQLRTYEEWLLRYANAWVDDPMRREYGETVVIRVRTALLGRVRYWQAEARAWIASPQVREWVAKLRNRDAQPEERNPEGAEPPVRTEALAEEQAHGAETVRPQETQSQAVSVKAPAQEIDSAQAPTDEEDDLVALVKGKSDMALREIVESLNPGLRTTAGKRALAVEAVRELILRRTGQLIPYTRIWDDTAHYTTADGFERWKRDDPRKNQTANKKFCAALKHLLPTT
jgi:hypothetical protein